MDTLHAWFHDRTSTQLRAIVGACLAAVVVGLALTLALDLEAATPWLGGIAGLGLYGVGHVWLTQSASPGFRERVDVKQRMPLAQRRAGTILFGLVWSSLLVYLASVLPEAAQIVLGTLQVAVVAALVNTFRMTPQERSLVEQAHLEGVAPAAPHVKDSYLSSDGATGDEGDFPSEGHIPPR